MNPEDMAVLVPYKEGFETEEAVKVWPLVEQALTSVDAEEITFDAARIAILSSSGCVVLTNYLVGEGSKVHKMDFSFRAPLLVLAAEHAKTDEAADTFLDTDVGVIYFETDDYQFAFNVMKDWTVDWRTVTDEFVSDYEPPEDINGGFALDILLAYADVGVESYRRQDDDV